MIPYNTDAPLYHWPIATVGLIVINTILWLVTPVEWVYPASARDDIIAASIYESDANLSEQKVESPYVLSLEYGNGIKPWQWVTSIFMHAGFFHLLFNMVTLWAFGLVVEGKVGALVFLALYFGIGVGESGIEQILLSVLVGEGFSLGASAAIFGLLAVAIVWAPRNEFDVFFLIGFRAFVFEIPIMYFGFINFASETINAAFPSHVNQAAVSSAVLHLMGFAVGLGFGFVWLIRGYVDCEGWDLITVLKGHEGRDFEKERLEKEAYDLVNSTAITRSEVASRVVTPPTPPAAYGPIPTGSLATGFHSGPAAVGPASVMGPSPLYAVPLPNADDLTDLYARPTEATVSPKVRLRQYIDAGQTTQALQSLIQLRKDAPYELPQEQLSKLIRDLLSQQDYTNAIPLMAEHIRRFADNRLTLQLNLARVLIQKQRPQKSLQVLKSIPRHNLDDRTEQTIAGLSKHAEEMIRNGITDTK